MMKSKGSFLILTCCLPLAGSVYIVLYKRIRALPSQCDLSGEKLAVGIAFNYTNECCDTDLCNTAVTMSSPCWTGAVLSLCSLALLLQLG